ncbi:unnamed protein product, partial [Rotaria socialis]
IVLSSPIGDFFRGTIWGFQFGANDSHSSFACSQLVLFDCDDDQFSLFEDHQKYLSRTSSSCECYIFWDDFKLPVYNNLKRIFGTYSHMHLSPSNCRQIDNSSCSAILSCLDELICKFSFVLLVHGDDQSYRSAFKRITKQYGKQKFELYAISKPFSQHLSYIATRLRKKKRQHNYHKYLKGLSSKDQLKHKAGSFFYYAKTTIRRS